MLHSELTEKIIACAYTVYNKMEYDYLESVYERYMLIELADGKKEKQYKRSKVASKTQQNTNSQIFHF
ncbi:MAG: hypothetical protein FVQ82_00040 [Planctomycetes bacterium]|nr:hypothetical protein [Planctomycetota bacterium]